MSATALMFALALAATDNPAPGEAQQGEPLPAGAPTQDYPLAAWCYGAMSEYLQIYDRVKPDLRAIDKMFGSSEPNEPEPYASDMAAARVELKVLADAVTAAEKASPSPIAPEGAEAVKLGRSVWAPAEAKTSRELARAWLSWALPDRCDTTARSLTTKSALLGQALKYNAPPPNAPDAAGESTSTAATPGGPPASPGAPSASVDSLLSSPAAASPSAAPPAPPSAASGPQAAAPSPEPTLPPAAPTQQQLDPNAPIPDPTTPKP
jgi:hypothetical protein